MKKYLATFCLLSICSSTFAASGIGIIPGLSDSMLKQYECTIQTQEIDSKTGKMGQKGSTYSIVVASDANTAKAVALNKLAFYGPVEGSLFYLTEDRRQFQIQGIICH